MHIYICAPLIPYLMHARWSILMASAAENPIPPPMLMELQFLKRDIADLEELRKAMGYAKTNILAHSYGTVVAQGYAIKYPDNVSHLILLAPFHSYAMWQENDDNSNKEG